jgi:hypothetical protein
MLPLLLTVAAFALSALNVNASQVVPTQDSAVVDLGYASYQGVYNESDSVTTFLGIRYAAPPIGTSLFWPFSHRQTHGGIQAV